MMTTNSDIERWLELEEIKYRASLVQCRIEAGISVDDLAMAMDRSVQMVQEVENFDSDPHLSTMRRYCAAIGALAQHRVTLLPEPESEGSPSTEARSARSNREATDEPRL